MSHLANNMTGRLSQTRTLRGAGIARWRSATIGIVGVGNIGWRLMLEAALSGAKVWLADPDNGSPDSDTQFAAAHLPKVEAAIAAANSVRPGCATGVVADVRHVGVGSLSQVDVLVDCSDDPALAIPLTKFSNATSIPLVRIAVDGSGERELARVQCSHGGAGHACQLCLYSIEDLFRFARRTPCPVPIAEEAMPRPTLAGGAIGAIAAGVGLLTVQRLVTGNDVEQVINREIILDLTSGQLLTLQRERSARCVSGHSKWQLESLNATATTTLAELFALIQQQMESVSVWLEPWLHPICTEAACACGHWQIAAGTSSRTPPRCERCGQAMHWIGQSAVPRISREFVDRMQLGDQTLAALGLPEQGALIIAHAANGPSRHWVLQ